MIRTRRFFKIIVVGDTGFDLHSIVVLHCRSGKTSLLMRYVNGVFSPNYQATIGASVLSKVVNEESELPGGSLLWPIPIQLWDTAGQERFQSLGTSFYRGADACVLVFDLCNGTSFENLGIWKSEFLLQTESSFRSESPFVLVGTKCDREADRDVSRDEVLSWCEQNKIPAENYFEVSAKTNANVEEVFDAVLGQRCD